jgi:hypothetical protein
MDRGVKPPGNQGKYKNITECGFARPRTPADQEPQHHQQHHHTKHITTAETTSPSQNHHHTIYPAHELSNREDSHHQHTIKSTKLAKPKTNMVT